MKQILHCLALLVLSVLLGDVPQTGQAVVAHPLAAAPAPQVDLVQQADQAFRTGDQEGAATLANRALLQHADPGHARMILGLAAARRRALEQAVGNFEALPRLLNAVGYMPKHPDVHYQLGLTYARLAQADKEACHSSLFRERDKQTRDLVAPAPNGSKASSATKQ